VNRIRGPINYPPRPDPTPRKWTLAEDEELVRLRPTISFRRIAKILGRTHGSVERRVYSLGIGLKD
jgi:hypothetical protein